jgi:sugar phosphate isomerase/epimerase|tara:strand:- start:485 stop:1498 length:1014 start_codon:yes stop_codon:yes gene_type:complete
MKVKIFILYIIPLFFYAQKENKPDLLADKSINIGVQSYSFRTLPDQSPLAILEYIKQTGVKYVELMGNHVEPFAGLPVSPYSIEKIMGNKIDPIKRDVLIKRYRKIELSIDEKKIADQIDKEMEGFDKNISIWRKNVSMSKFKELRKMYNDAGISIFAFKPRCFEKNNSDEDIRYGMRAAKALGATHVTTEHPSDDKHTARLGKIAEEEGIFVGYHGHMQSSPTLWNTSVSQSNYNRLNLDLGHYTAAEVGDPLQIIKDKSDKIVSMHLKDRKKLSNGGENKIWGQGDTPIKEAVQLIKDNGYSFFVTIELEYDIPEGSNEIKEVKNCVAYIQNAMN